MQNNRIVLVGNGLDIAAGFKTSYQEFIRWIIIDDFENRADPSISQIRLIEIKESQVLRPTINFPQNPLLYEIDDPLEMINRLKNAFDVSIMNPFFERILDRIKTDKWIDLEQFYFNELLILFDSFRNIHGNSFGDKEPATVLNGLMVILDKDLMNLLQHGQIHKLI
ncbi:MAG: hypothetical protein ACI9YL_001733 [Luteibaculaceae bacterium]|jgi:hypothetical protein